MPRPTQLQKGGPAAILIRRIGLTAADQTEPRKERIGMAAMTVEQVESRLKSVRCAICKTPDFMID
ncbi:MAG: hypothetical protein AABY90_10520, partial [Nitrospirota bacterium]